MAKVKIPAHVFGYSLALIPAFFYGYHYQQNKPSEDAFEEKLRKTYSHNINGSSSKRKEMLKFMDAIKSGEADERLDEILRAGKGGMKRHYSVDERYFGKEEGIVVKGKVVQELEEKRIKRKNLTKGEEKSNFHHESEGKSRVFQRPSLILLGTIGVATLISFLGGDRR